MLTFCNLNLLGLGAPLASTPVLLGLNIGVYATLHRELIDVYLRKFPPPKASAGAGAVAGAPSPSSSVNVGVLLLVHGIAGGTAGAVQSVFSSPFEFVRVKMQMLSYQTARVSTLQFAKALYKNNGGLRGFYPPGAWTANCMTLTVGSASYFAIHALLTRSMARFATQGNEESLTFIHRVRPKFLFKWLSCLLILFCFFFLQLVVGGFTGMLNWCFIFPFDLTRTRVMHACVASAGSSAPAAVPSFFGTMFDFARQRGFRALYSGFPIAFFRSFPTNAIFMAVYATLTSTAKT